ncbi:uncharacterized protein LOC135482436 [Lineus longissimus]|uniref:uncharacterized protein LOC135482436 n=1 Tax=Lineus longissimus TaxID=88925 RepID=UPI002B4D4F7E
MASNGSADLENEHQRIDSLVTDPKWLQWGPYVGDREWGTARESYICDYWKYVTFDNSHKLAYRWGEDALFGVCDDQCYLCLGLCLWNGKDTLLKEKLFGLTSPEGNHGEDVKELYYHLMSTPTHSYMKALYKYPHNQFPYEGLRESNAERKATDPEYEIFNTGVFDEDRYWDVEVEYAKDGPSNILCQYTITNRGPETIDLHVIPSLWFRNTWQLPKHFAGYVIKPEMEQKGNNKVECQHRHLGCSTLLLGQAPDGSSPEIIFTENETNYKDVYDEENISTYTKEAFHRYIIEGETEAVSPEKSGTKCGAVYKVHTEPGVPVVIRCQLSTGAPSNGSLVVEQFSDILEKRKNEATEYYNLVVPASIPEELRSVNIQALAGLLWNKQFYFYCVEDWLTGHEYMTFDDVMKHRWRTNWDWEHVKCMDIISMPDKWEFPWFAAWDLAFHAVAFSVIDIEFAKSQLLLLLSHRYMKANGQIPAYEMALADTNPPVHVWACWKIFQATVQAGKPDRDFLEKCFHKLQLNFTWWVNVVMIDKSNLYGGGFLGLDNIAPLNRSHPPAKLRKLYQVDGTAWMALFTVYLMKMSLELAKDAPHYEDYALTYLRHFDDIKAAINGYTDRIESLWDPVDSFYYDRYVMGKKSAHIKLRSMVGLVPLFSTAIFLKEDIEHCPTFCHRLGTMLNTHSCLEAQVAAFTHHDQNDPAAVCEALKEASMNMQSYQCNGKTLLTIPSIEQIKKILSYMLNEEELLSPHGIRSLSKHHKTCPFMMRLEKRRRVKVMYEAAESTSDFYGGNSNWRGPVWLCMNYLIIESLETLHDFLGDKFTIEYPTGTGQVMNLQQIATDLTQRNVNLFLPDSSGKRPCHGNAEKYATDPVWRDLVLFYENYDGDTGRGCGASHNTGWNALVSNMILKLTKDS